MRMEELANNNFIKSTDSVERYLLDVIKNYFNTSGIANEDSKEYVIQKAVERMKEELYIDNAGVVSVNGKTGVVTITLAELGGEPEIKPKYSAFNVDFGKEANTACEGNDPRLSDKRKPIQHVHTIDDINGLSGELSTIKNNINLLGNKTHKHDNKTVLDKLIYTGEKDNIDLTILDTVESTITNKIIEVDNNIDNISSTFGTYATQITNTYNQYKTDYDTTIASIETKGNAVTAAVDTYCDTAIANQNTEIQALLNDKITKAQLNGLIQIVNKGFSSIYDTDISGFITTTNEINTYEFTLPREITTALSVLDSAGYKIEFKIKYTDPDTLKENISSAPFLYTSEGKMKYTITVGLVDKSIVKIIATRFTDAWGTFISNATISCRISTLNNIPEVS